MKDYSDLYEQHAKRKQAERTRDMIDRFILTIIGAAVAGATAMHFAIELTR